MTIKQSHWPWIILLLIAAGARLIALGHAPLGPDEAIQAVAALDIPRGVAWPAEVDSPLLLVGNGLLFALFGASESVARLLPALAGLALVAIPWLWRREVGDLGAGTASALLIFSPLALFASRRVESTTLGVLGAGLLLAALFLGEHERRPWQRPLLIACGIALGVIGGPAFYDTLLPALSAWLIFRWISESEAQAVSSIIWRRWLRPVGLGVAAAWWVAIGAGFYWGHWGRLGQGLVAWLSAWRSVAPGQLGVMLLMLYEPLTLLLAGVGLIFAIRRFALRPLMWALWGMLTLLLTSMRPGVPATGVIAALLPLTLLAGYGARHLPQAMTHDQRLMFALHVAVGLVLWMTGGLMLARYTVVGATVQGWPLAFLGLAAILALQGILAVLFGFSAPANIAARGALLAVCAVALVLQVSFAWGLAFVRPDDPAELAITASGSPDLANLRAVATELMYQRGERQDSFAVAIVDADAALTALARWQFRDFTQVEVTPAWPASPPDLVITPAEGAPAMPAMREAQAPEGAWRGANFVAITGGKYFLPGCQPAFPPICPQTVTWYLYRNLPTVFPSQDVILWHRP